MDGNLPGVSAILLNWKRPYHLLQIVPHLETIPFIEEIIVWNNNPEPIDVPEQDVPIIVVNSEKNYYTYGRYLAAAHAKNQILYTQDDDVLVKNIPELYRQFLSHQERVTAGLADGHYRYEANRKPWLLCGWGAFFKRDWLEVIRKWIGFYGDDFLLHRKFDRIWTILYGKNDPQHASIERLKGPDGKDSDRDGNSLWLRPDHLSLTDMAAERALFLKSFGE